MTKYNSVSKCGIEWCLNWRGCNKKIGKTIYCVGDVPPDCPLPDLPEKKVVKFKICEDDGNLYWQAIEFEDFYSHFCHLEREAVIEELDKLCSFLGLTPEIEEG
jgi:hypothetical protein